MPNIYPCEAIDYMSFLLLLLEVYPDLVKKINDVWFEIQAYKGLDSLERLALERGFLDFAALCFKSRGEGLPQRDKWEPSGKTRQEIEAFLNNYLRSRGYGK